VAASMPADEGKSPEEWAEEMEKGQDLGTGATAEDAAELAATMADELHTDEEAQSAAVVAAAAAAAAEAVDSPLDDPAKLSETEAMDAPMDDATKLATMDESGKMAASQPKRLTKERKEKLDAIGFVWSLRSKRIDDHWDEMFRKVRAWLGLVNSQTATCVRKCFYFEMVSNFFLIDFPARPIQGETWRLLGPFALRRGLETWKMGRDPAL